MQNERVFLEEHLAKKIGTLGPFITVGNPEEKIAPLGAYRAYFKGEDWREAIPLWISATPLIIFIVGGSGNAAWEIEKIVEGGALGKTVFVFPGSEHLHATAQRDDHELRRSWFNQVMSDLAVQDNLAGTLCPSSAFLTFPAKGAPLVINVPTRNDLAFTISFELAYHSLFCRTTAPTHSGRQSGT